jgi:hypothetical protein
MEGMVGRGRSLAIGGLATGLVALCGLVAGANRSEAGGGEPSLFTHTYLFTGSEQQFEVPPTVRSVHVVAIGGAGASSAGITGGSGARVEADLAVEPDSTLFIEVGGNGSGTTGGFNGGGPGSNIGGSSSAGGGGASDLRTVSRIAEGTLGSRELVAGGGGGAGGRGQVANDGALGGAGGGASVAGANGGTNGGTVNARGGGGGAGTAAGVGAGGSAGTVGTGFSGTAGDPGVVATGGAGGLGDAGGGPGGGGGGGRSGGGGGGGGGLDTSVGTPHPAGGGGGGGGSSLVPAGGSATLAGVATAASVEITYAIPGTDSSGPTGPISTKTPQFEFSSLDLGATFECRLDSTDPDDFVACVSPFTTPALEDGKHRFEVRAVNEAGNSDATPATYDFRVDTKRPNTKITKAPNSTVKTGGTRAKVTFRFRANEPRVNFECKVDSAPYKECESPRSFRAKLGRHTFKVRGEDRAGNRERKPATASFKVVRR